MAKWIRTVLILQLVFSPLTSVELFAQDYEFKVYDEAFKAVDLTDFSTQYIYSIDGTRYLIQLERVVPEPSSTDGKMRVFKIISTQEAPDVSGDGPHIEVYKPNQGEVGVANSGGSTSMGSDAGADSGLSVDTRAGTGNGSGWKDVVGGGLLVYGTGTAYVAGYEASTGVSKALRNGFINNLNAAKKYANAIAESGAIANRRGQRSEVAAGYRAGTRSGSRKFKGSDNSEGESRVNNSGEPAICSLAMSEGKFNEMPADFQRAYINQDYERIAEYVSLLYSDSEINQHCISYLKLISNSEYLLNLRYLRPDIGASPLESWDMKTFPETPAGKMVRDIANRYQVLWVNSHTLETMNTEQRQSYLAGLAVLKASDAAAASGDVKGAGSYGKASEILLNIANGFNDGIAVAVSDLVESAPALAKALNEFIERGIGDPNYVVEATQNLINSIPEIAEQIEKELIKNYNTLENGSAYERSVLAGKVAFDVGLNFVTGGAVRIVSKGVNVIRSTEKAANTAAKLKRFKKLLPNSRYDNYLRGRTLTHSSKFAKQLKARKVLDRFKGGHQRAVARGLWVSEGAKDFVAGQIVNEEKIIGLGKKFSNIEIDEMFDKYSKSESKFDLLEPAEFKGTVMRGISKEVSLSEGVTSYPTKHNVFDFHDGTYKGNGRWGAPGDIVSYTIVGDDIAKTGQHIVAEARAGSLDNLITGKAKLDMDKVLDFSDSKIGQKNLKVLGLKRSDILKPNDYKVPQMIGDMGRKRGFTGVLAPSAQPGVVGTNLGIF